MTDRKRFLAPFYMLGFIFLVGVAFLVPPLMGVLNADKHVDTPTTFYLRDVFVYRLVKQLIILFVLLVECLVYWSLREKIRRKDFAWGHAIGMLLGLVIIPLGIDFYADWANVYNDPTVDNTYKLHVIAALNRGLFAVFMLLAHICFAFMLVDVWKSRQQKPREVINSQDILSEYADQQK